MELRESQTTTLGGGFHANSVTQTQDHFEALENLATATANDRGAMATLAEINKLLTEKLLNANTKLLITFNQKFLCM